MPRKQIAFRTLAGLLVCSTFGVAALVRAAEGPKAAAGDAAFTNPAFANPDTPGLLAGNPRADVPNVSDIVFLKQLAIGGRAEVELGKLAQERSGRAGIDDFGQHMVKDHSGANNKLSAVARAAKVELPTALDAEHEAARGELAALRGDSFDLRYVESQIKDHQKAVQLLIYEIGSGQHAGSRLFAQETLPTVMAHLEKARALHAELTGAGPPPPPSAMR
jgi:putative membrane protein